MTKTKIFNSKITIPILISLTVAIVIAFSMPQAEAGHSSITGDSSRTGLVGDTLTYTGFVNQFFGTESSLFSISCDSPATGTVSPTRINAGGRPITVTVTSAVAGEFECTVLVEHCGPFKGQFPCERNGRNVDHSDELVYTSTFNNPPPPPIMCGSGTVPQGNECVQDPVVTQQIIELQSDLTDCQSQNDQLTSDLVQCEADNVTLNQQIINLQGIITGLESTIADLQSEIQNLLDILLSGEITICHKEKNTQTIGLDAFGTHAGHGDTIGPCE